MLFCFLQVGPENGKYTGGWLQNLNCKNKVCVSDCKNKWQYADVSWQDDESITVSCGKFVSNSILIN